MTNTAYNGEKYAPKAAPDQDRYKTSVAGPVMQAVDSMPPEYRVLVHEFGYVDVYRAWRRAWTVDEIRARAKALGGRFSF